MKPTMSKIGYFLSIFFLITLYCSEKSSSPKTDLLVFSYDRPLQLYAFLESVDYYITGLHTIYVIYRYSESSYKDAYENVKSVFPHLIFIPQQPPYKDFKHLTLDAIFKTDSPYIIFGVDDIIVKDFIDLDKCIAALQAYDSYGFFLSLGTHLTDCYSMNKKQKLPSFCQHSQDICEWSFCDGEYDWAYPHNLDMTLYKKSDLASWLYHLGYTSPNTLEYQLAIQKPIKNKGLCFSHSKVLNFPLNIVQQDWLNLNIGAYTPAYLLSLYTQNLKIDIKPLFQYLNNARHVENASLITFVPREKEIS